MGLDGGLAAGQEDSRSQDDAEDETRQESIDVVRHVLSTKAINEDTSAVDRHPFDGDGDVYGENKEGNAILFGVLVSLRVEDCKMKDVCGNDGHYAIRNGGFNVGTKRKSITSEKERDYLLKENGITRYLWL